MYACAVQSKTLKQSRLWWSSRLAFLSAAAAVGFVSGAANAGPGDLENPDGTNLEWAYTPAGHRASGSLVLSERTGSVGIGTYDPSASLTIMGEKDVALGARRDGGLMIGHPSQLNLAIDRNEIQSRNDGEPGVLHLQREGGAVLINGINDNVAHRTAVDWFGNLTLGYSSVFDAGVKPHFLGARSKYYGEGTTERVFAVNGEVTSKYLSADETYARSATFENLNLDVLELNRIILGEEAWGLDKPNVVMSADGTVAAEEIVVTSKNWGDDVFEPDYELPTLDEVETHIRQNGHLPGVPSQADFDAQGSRRLAETDVILIRKIEELTLYTLQQEKRIRQLEARKSTGENCATK